MGMKVKTKVKINPNSKRLDVKELASGIIQAALELNKKWQRCQFEETEEEEPKKDND